MPPKELPKAEGEEQKPKKRSRFKIIMLLGSVLLVLGAGGGAGYWWLFMRPDATGFAGLFGSSEAEKAPPAAAQTPEASAQGGKTASTASTSTSPRALFKPVPLPTLTVNLADGSGNRYLKIGMEVEVSAQDAVQELQNQNARVRDAIILLLSSKTVAELTSAEGKVLLKNEVVARLNQILGAPRVVRMYFTDFVIQ